MTIELDATAASLAQAPAGLLVLPCFTAREAGAWPAAGPGVAQASQALGADLAGLLSGQSGFAGEVGQTAQTLTLGRLPAARILLLGLGDQDEAGPAQVRQAAMMAAAELASAPVVATTVPAALGTDAAAEAASAFAEGLLLGAWRFGRYKRRPLDRESLRPPSLVRLLVLTDETGTPAARAGLRRGELLARTTNWVRDLVTTPSADLTPEDMAGQARDLAAGSGLTCSVLGGAELASGGFGGILGVGQGSAHEPRLVELGYRGGGDAPVIALTGKGITFDSGGLSLKVTSEIEWMKSDMAGAATIMAVLRAAAELGLPVNLDAALPFAENMPGGSAIRPGDVLTHRGGRTSEVLDTDSEGRLVIADALAYLAERSPAALVDVATLTDAAGLGDALFAAMGNDRPLLDAVLAAGEMAGDPGWPLPLPPAYLRYLESPVADLRNVPKGVPDSTVLAGLFLSQFAGEVPWVHIDNGSVAYLEEATDCWPEGATGSPARALLRWIEGVR
jgi:leucyl aminopeptidase